MVHTSSVLALAQKLQSTIIAGREDAVLVQVKAAIVVISISTKHLREVR
jgi:hypothetical protein